MERFPFKVLQQRLSVIPSTFFFSLYLWLDLQFVTQLGILDHDIYLGFQSSFILLKVKK